MATKKATAKQISFAQRLMGENGYETTWMKASHAALGATMRQRSGKVEDWLASLSVSEISRVIDQLKREGSRA